MENYLLGVDIGGTSVKMGLFKEDGKIADKWEIRTKTREKADQIPFDIWKSIRTKMTEQKINHGQLIGIGAGAPGFVISETGVIAEAVNVGWRDFPLAERLRELSQLPVFIENDANIAALGENWLGSGQLADNLIAITLGTGVGGGIIANGKIVSGVNGVAGEIGHMTVELDGSPCNCGRRGCLETIASATGIRRIAEEKVKQYKDSLLVTTFKRKNKITSKDVFSAYKKEDQCAQAIVEEITDVLGLAIANLAVIINPEKIVIGGGVSKAGNLLLKPLERAYKKYALPRSFEGSSFAIASLGNDAGIVGAAYLVKQNQTL